MSSLARPQRQTTAPLVQEGKVGAVRMYDFAVPIYVLNERRAVARLGISLEREWAGIRRMGGLILGLGVRRARNGPRARHLAGAQRDPADA